MYKYPTLLFIVLFAFLGTVKASVFPEYSIGIMELTYQQRYSEALQLADSIQKKEKSQLPTLLKSMVLLNKYEDLGDTLWVNELDSTLNTLDTTGFNLFWKSFSIMQKAFVEEIQGNGFSALLKFRSGANEMESCKKITDANAFVSMYTYFRSSAFDWVPGISKDTAKVYSDLKQAINKSRILAPVFINALVWIYYEEKRYDDAINLMNKYKDIFPGNRIFLQNMADMYHAKGDLKKAEIYYTQSLREYEVIAPGSVRHLCALGNLTVITHKQNKPEESQKYEQLFYNKKYQAMHKWLPEEIVDKVENIN